MIKSTIFGAVLCVVCLFHPAAPQAQSPVPGPANEAPRGLPGQKCADGTAPDNVTRVFGAGLCLAAKTYLPPPQQRPNAPIVIFLHADGAGKTSATYWTRIGTNLAKSLNVIAVALLRPGYTDGTVKSDGNASPNDDDYRGPFVDTVAGVIDSLRAYYPNRKVILTGHSGGAALTTLVMGIYPGKADGAVAVGCPCDVPEWRRWRSAQRGQSYTPWSSLSPLLFAEGVVKTAPVIVVVGDKDDNTLPRFGQAYIAELQRYGVTHAEFMSAPNVTHGASIDSPVYHQAVAKVIEEIRVTSASGVSRGTAPIVSPLSAQTVTDSAPEAGFQPPPRTISDIAAILDRQKPDPAKIAAAIVKADAPPPPDGLEGAQLAKFFFDRSFAANELGRLEQRVADLRVAIPLARKANVPAFVRNNYLQQLGDAEGASGRIDTAISINETRVAEAINPNNRFNALAGLLGWVSNRGDQVRIADVLQRMEVTLIEILQNPNLVPFERAENQSTMLRARGLVAMGAGRYADAEKFYRESLSENAKTFSLRSNNSTQADVAVRGPLSDRTFSFTQNLALSILRQGRLVEAEVETRRVLLGRLERHGRYSADTLNIVLSLADNLLEQGRISEAERLARVAYESFEAMKFDPYRGGFYRALATIAHVQTLGGETQAALQSFAEMHRLNALGADRSANARTFDTNLRWAMASLAGGDANEAVRVFGNIAARRNATLGERHWDTAIARALLGAAKGQTGDIDGALVEFDAASPILLQGSRQSDDEEQSPAAREAQLRIAFEGMMAALARSARPTAAEEAFRVADAVRGQSVQRALAQSSARAAASDPALAEFVRQEQDTQKQIGALQGRLTNIMSAAVRDDAAAQTLRGQIDGLRAARAAIRQEIERRFPDYASLIDPRPATVEQTRRALRPGEALIATYVGQSQSFVWAVPHTGAVAFASVALNRKAIGEAVANLRNALDPNAASLDDIPVFDVALAAKLYDDLLKPVETGFAAANSLLVVPHDSLGQLPFGVLVTVPTKLAAEQDNEALFSSYKSVPFLIRKAAITQLPSVASLASLRSLPPAPADRLPLIAFGDPWFNKQQMAEAKEQAAAIQTASLVTRGAASRLQTRGLPLVRRSAPAATGVGSAEFGLLPRLPDTADEVRGIASALNADASDLFLGAAANEKNVKTQNLSNRRVVMFATHGLIPGELNGLTQPALALSAPDVADIDGDGLLTLDEVLGLKLNADWVVLSACNTATGDGAGAEAVSGLGRAFFYAGTRALLVTNWPVETNSARTLTTDLFDRQARDPTLARAAALQQAMVGLLDGPGSVNPANGQTVFAYSHPIFWAPFSLVGDGGGQIQ